MSGYFQYFSFGLSGYIDRLLLRVREEVFQIFERTLAPAAGDTILDVGASGEEHVSSNYLEKRYRHTTRICALTLDHIPALAVQFPGIRLVQGDARALPFADLSFDFVYSHAVIEHLGSRVQQAAFLAEVARVARKGVLLTTPNRWHPFEPHTGLPLLHYLPAPAYRILYRLLGKGGYATEAALSPLSARQLRKLVPGLAVTVTGVRWLGITSNLVLVLRRV